MQYTHQSVLSMYFELIKNRLVSGVEIKLVKLITIHTSGFVQIASCTIVLPIHTTNMASAIFKLEYKQETGISVRQLGKNK